MRRAFPFDVQSWNANGDKWSEIEHAILLCRKIANVARDGKYSQQIDRVLVDQLLDLVVEDYQIGEAARTTLSWASISISGPFFWQKQANGCPLSVLAKFSRPFKPAQRDACPPSSAKSGYEGKSQARRGTVRWTAKY